MLDSHFPLELDCYDPRSTIADIIEHLLGGELVIYGWPEPADVRRPPLKYVALMLVEDISLGMPGLRRLAMGTSSDPTPDCRQWTTESREAVIRCHFFGPLASSRAARLSSGASLQSVRSILGDIGLHVDRRIVDSTREIGHQNEHAAYVDALIRYRRDVPEDHHSINRVTLDAAYH